MKICPKCFAQFGDEAVFCENCGTRLQMQMAHPQAQPAPTPAPAPVHTPVVTETENFYPDVPAGNQPEKKKTNVGMIIGIVVAAVFALAAIGTGVFFLFFSDVSPLNKEKNETVVEDQTQEVVYIESAPETTTVAETTTASFTSPAPEAASDVKVYSTFFNFYVSYLNGINSLNSNYIEHCTPTVKSEMVERFQYNKKSLFDLSRIDFDVDSYSVSVTSYTNEHTFYVKCVSRMYDRESLNEKEINYAVWKVTVTERDGECVVSRMERNDKYKMGTNIEVMTDDVSVF